VRLELGDLFFSPRRYFAVVEISKISIAHGVVAPPEDAIVRRFNEQIAQADIQLTPWALEQAKRRAVEAGKSELNVKG